MSQVRRRVAAATMLGLVATLAPGTTGASAQGANDARPAALLGAASTPDDARGTVPKDADRSRYVTLAEDAFDHKTIGFEVFPGLAFTGVVDATSSSAGSTSWSGTLDDGHGTWSAARVQGVYNVSLYTDAGAFEISNAGGDTYRVVQTQDKQFTALDEVEEPKNLGGETPAPTATSSSASADKTAADAGNVVDVLVVHTALAASEAGGVPAFQAQVTSTVADANAALANSGVGYTLRLVGVVPTATTETGGELDTDLIRARTLGDGYYEEAQSSRNALHADLVSLWIGGAATTTCGLGYLSTSEATGFSAVFRECATSNRSFIHELGHNFLAGHDASASESPDPSQAPYARGYVDLTAKTYTIMAYASACTAAGISCVRIPYFSNPAVLYNGRPTGTDAANNARVVQENFARVAQYRQDQIYPGAVAIAGTARYKKTVTVNTGTWAPANTGLTVQWMRDGVPISGATGKSLTLGKGMIGHTLSAVVTGSAPFYTAVAASSAPYVVGKALFRKKRLVLVGQARVGRVLAAVTKIKPKAKKIKYSWYRNGKKIKGAKGRTYRIRRGDRGKKIQVKIVATKKGYEALVKKSKKRKVR